MGGLGHHLGGSARRFGAILGVRVGSGSQMRLGRRLGPSWRRLGGVLEASWAVLGRKRWPTSPPSWLPKRRQNRFPKSSMFRSIFASIFVPFWLQLGTLLGLKMESSWPLKSAKSRPRRLPRRTWERKPAQTFKMAPKCSPSSPQECPRPPQDPPKPSPSPPQDLSQKPPKVLINWRGGTKAQPS